MKVAHVITTLNVGGAERLLLDLCERLPRYGIESSVIYLKGGGPLAAEFESCGVPAEKVGLRAAVDPVAVVALARRLRSLAPDVVHTHMFKADLHGTLAARRAGVAHIVSTKHAAEEARRLAPVALIDRRLAAAADAIVAVSEDMAAFTREVEGIPGERIRVIYSGIDLSRFDAARPKEAALAKLGLAPGSPIVLATGRLHPAKGHSVLIKAMRQVRRAWPDARLVIAGEGEERERLAAEAAPDGDSVVLLSRRHDVADLLSVCDCYVLPSLREGLGLALIEAMALGRPCVATRAGAIPEVITDGIDGLLVPSAQPDALAIAIGRILADRTLAERLSVAARAAARERFDIDRTAAEYAALYREITKVPAR